MVNVMNDNSAFLKTLDEELQSTAAFRQRTEDRRKVPSMGFAYISVVGWICRREQYRRRDSKMDTYRRAGRENQQ